jgi:hypothetical protein
MGMSLFTSGCALLEAKCTYLEPFPAVVQVPVSSTGPITFEVYARLRKGNGEILNDPIEWSPGAGLSVSPTHGRTVIVKVDPGTAGDHEITSKAACACRAKAPGVVVMAYADKTLSYMGREVPDGTVGWFVGEDEGQACAITLPVTL